MMLLTVHNLKMAPILNFPAKKSAPNFSFLVYPHKLSFGAKFFNSYFSGSKTIFYEFYLKVSFYLLQINFTQTNKQIFTIYHLFHFFHFSY